VDAHPFAPLHTELGRGFGRDLLYPPDDLVPRHGREHPARGLGRMAAELIHVTMADADRLDPQEGAGGSELGFGRPPQLPSLIPFEHDGTRHPNPFPRLAPAGTQLHSAEVSET
jgi:hypothetical protein